jgi:hypothetical protein
MDNRKPARIVNATGEGKGEVDSQPWRLRSQAWVAHLTLTDRSRLYTEHDRYLLCLIRRIKSVLVLIYCCGMIRLTVCCVLTGELEVESFVSERWCDEGLRDRPSGQVDTYLMAH